LASALILEETLSILKELRRSFTAEPETWLGESPLPVEDYAAHRGELAARVAAGVSTVVVGAVVLYAAVEWALRREAFYESLPLYAAEMLIPLLVLSALRFVPVYRVPCLMLVEDLAFTVVLIGQFLLPSTTVSGATVILSLKNLATFRVP
jgi:hypothetical protein